MLVCVHPPSAVLLRLSSAIASAKEDKEDGSVVKGHLVAFYRLCVLGALAVNDPGILPFKEKLVTKLVTNWLQTQKSPFSRDT